MELREHRAQPSPRLGTAPWRKEMVLRLKAVLREAVWAAMALGKATEPQERRAQLWFHPAMVRWRREIGLRDPASRAPRAVLRGTVSAAMETVRLRQTMGGNKVRGA